MRVLFNLTLVESLRDYRVSAQSRAILRLFGRCCVIELEALISFDSIGCLLKYLSWETSQATPLVYLMLKVKSKY